MRIAFYDTKSYDIDSFSKVNADFKYDLDFFDFPLDERTAITAKDHEVVCAFVNANLSAKVIAILASVGVKLIAMRCAGFNNVDLKAAQKVGIPVVRVPAYSPHSIAEHALALLLSLTRHIPQAYVRTRSGNFNIQGLAGRDLNGLAAGILGTGKIGKIMATILSGFGMKIFLYDLYPDEAWARENGFQYLPLENFFASVDVLSLHCPLTEQTRHIVNQKTLALMKKDAVIINTGRGALIETKALVKALKTGQIGGAALDVYEEESRYFFNDWSVDVINDDVLARLLTFPNVIITGHQAFLTTDALMSIATTTLNNVKEFKQGNPLQNEVLL